jgi:hypothetical protein
MAKDDASLLAAAARVDVITKPIDPNVLSLPIFRLEYNESASSR